METRIKESINNPEQLERLYRADKKSFEKSFFSIYHEIADFKIAESWKARLEYENQGEPKIRIKKSDVLFLIITCLITGFLIKIPQIFDIGLDDYVFYERNAGLIVLLGLSAYLFILDNP